MNAGVDPVIVVIPGTPQGKGRARSFVHKQGPMAGRIGHHTPEKTRSYEGVIKSLGIDAMGRAGPFTCPIRLEVCSEMPVPVSWSRWKQEMALAAQIVPTGKPDPDNILKAVMDGLNGVAWIDDVQVVEFVLVKRYVAAPRVVAVIIPLRKVYGSQVARGDVRPAAPKPAPRELELL
ncbi:MAG TPA: RusA family crossover junction endodeoxyribonuclease [Nevskia sp.]|nr:RusA family crossover junction endodeoxyribonuclease [Nevskia sp.]